MRDKTFLGLILAAAVLAGCSSDDLGGTQPVVPEESDVPMKFETNISKMQDGTRATGVITDPSDMAENGFGVFCIYTNTTPIAEIGASSDTATIMNNLRITSPDEGVSWTYSPPRYWPEKEKYLSFYSYAPYINKGTATDVTEDAPMRLMYDSDNKFTGKIQFYESMTPANQHDLLFGTATDGSMLTDWRCNKDTADADATVANKTTKNGNITTDFHHATAKLAVFVNHSFDKIETNNQRIYISRVVLKNLPKKGILDITKSKVGTTSTVEPSVTPSWSDIEGNDSIVLTYNDINSDIAFTGSFVGGNGVPLDSNKNKQPILPTSSDYLLLLPNESKTEQMEISITYIPISRSINGNYYSGTRVTVNKALNTKIVGNKSYTLNVTLGANTVITMETQPWEQHETPTDANSSYFFSIPTNGYMSWTGDSTLDVSNQTGFVSVDSINEAQCQFRINSIAGKAITCKAELLDYDPASPNATSQSSKVFTFDNNSTSMTVTPDNLTTLKIKCKGETEQAYARLRITVTYGGKDYIVRTLSGTTNFEEYILSWQRPEKEQTTGEN